MELGLKGKTAIITGGSTGIGRATAFAFAREGVNVAICARNTDNIAKVIEAGKADGLDIYGESLDITNTAEYSAFVDRVAEKFGGIDILFSNAGRPNNTYLMDTKREDWNAVIDLNLTAVWEGAKLVVPYMKKQGGGNIVSTTSLAARIPTTRRGIYAITKAGVSSMTVMLASELAANNIRVNAVSPGVVVSEMVNAGLKVYDNMDYLTESAIMQRLGEPEEIANVVLFLCSDLASFITGEVLDVSGGKFKVQDPWVSWRRVKK